MLDEHVFTSHSFRSSTKYPVIHIPGIAVDSRTIRWKFKGKHEEVWDSRSKEDQRRTFKIHYVKNLFYHGSENKFRKHIVNSF